MTSATPSTTAAHGFSEAAFASFLQGRNEPTWLSDLRRQAFQTFQSLPMPSYRDEEWRRTDIRALKLENFGFSGTGEVTPTAIELVARASKPLESVYATGLAHADAGLVRTSDSSKLDGLIFTDLATAVREHPDLVRKHLMTQAFQVDADAFSALHAAGLSGGCFLYVPAGKKFDQPLFNLIAMSSAGQVDFSHTLVVLEDDAEATLVQETTSGDRGKTPGLHVGGVELILGRNSRLRFVNIQNWDDNTWHFSRERALVGQDAALQWTVGGLGSRLAKVNQEVALTGRGARAQVNGVMFTSGRQNLTYITRQDHAAPDTTSDLLYKGGLKDQSRLVWRGMIRVEPDAQKTDAYQKNDNLILDERARADSIPGLEIEANEVRCTHGATAGPVDPDMVFYCQSRGISRDVATRLIVEGFFANVYDRISLEPVRETLLQTVAEKLEHGGHSTLLNESADD